MAPWGWGSQAGEEEESEGCWVHCVLYLQTSSTWDRRSLWKKKQGQHLLNGSGTPGHFPSMHTLIATIKFQLHASSISLYLGGTSKENKAKWLEGPFPSHEAMLHSFLTLPCSQNIWLSKEFRVEGSHHHDSLHTSDYRREISLPQPWFDAYNPTSSLVKTVVYSVLSVQASTMVWAGVS